MKRIIALVFCVLLCSLFTLSLFAQSEEDMPSDSTVIPNDGSTINYPTEDSPPQEEQPIFEDDLGD